MMEKYKYFLQDLVSLLKEKLEKAKECEFSTKREFEQGVTMGIYESIDLIKQQANIFEIPLEEIGLDNYPLEKFL